MNDIFDYDFFEDATEDVDAYDDYDDAYEDVDMFDENYFEAMEGPARDYRHEQNKGKSRDQVRVERERNYLKQTHGRGNSWLSERTIQDSRRAENQRLRGEGVYGFQEYKEANGGKGTAKGYARHRNTMHQYGIYNTGPYDTLPEYNKRVGIKNGVVKPAK